MTTVRVPTNQREVDEIVKGDRRHIVRTEKLNIKKGDVIEFQLYRSAQPVLGQINSRKYLATIVEDWKTPTDTKIIGIREIRC